MERMQTEIELPQRLAWWRKALKLTQADIAKAAGCTVSAVSHFERGTADPTQARLEAIVKRGLKTTMARFYGPLPRIAA